MATDTEKRKFLNWPNTNYLNPQSAQILKGMNSLPYFLGFSINFTFLLNLTADGNKAYLNKK